MASTLRRLPAVILSILAAACASRHPDPCAPAGGAFVPLGRGPRHLQTVFVLALENANWSQLRGNPGLPFLNGTLLRQGAHAERYFNPPGLHPSEPNYLWMEAGTNLGVRDDQDPVAHHFATRDHLVSLLGKAGLSWKSYQQGISAGECPVHSHGFYAAKHNPFVFFDDVTTDRALCAAHHRPLEELEDDLRQGTVARYNFISPDLCHDMHGARGCEGDPYQAADSFLALWVPRIQESAVFRQAVLFIVWDEGEGSSSDGPIGFIALSPFAKAGYAGGKKYTHSSLLRSVQEILGVGPLLCDAAAAADVADLFTAFP